MKNFYDYFLEKVDPDFLMKETEILWKKEFGQTYQAYHEAAFYTRDLLLKAGIPNVELLECPADGKTACCDVRMPIAWDATVGKLTLLNAGSCVSGPFGGKGPDIVAADYQLHPFSLVKGSVLPEGKKKVRIISETQLLSGADARGALVLLDQEVRPYGNSIKTILDMGALGFVSDNVTGCLEYPDSLAWFNAATEDGEWHVTAKQRPFLGFSITPRMGAFIREILKKRNLLALAECDGRRYEGIHHVVTALIPGKQKKEVWAYAHLYEPLPDDDACGVVAAIETAKQIMKEGTPEYSVRLVFGMEFYGYHAYIAGRGGNLNDIVVGGCNYDGLACTRDAQLKCYTCPGGTPCYGNYMMEELNAIISREKKAFTAMDSGSAYFDDISFSCPSIGIPAVWPLCIHGLDHHTSRQTMTLLDREAFAQGTAYDTALIYMMANPSEDMLEDFLSLAEKHVLDFLNAIRRNSFGSDRDRFTRLCEIEHAQLQAFIRAIPGFRAEEKLKEFDEFCCKLGKDLKAEDPARDSKWRKIASKIRMQYTATGFPHSLTKAGDQIMFSIPEGCIYGPFSNVIANLHQEMSLAEAFRLAEYERGAELPEETIRKYINTLNRLADCGYLRVATRPELTREEIVSALQKLGVKKGDLLMVHSSSSKCGYVRGGAETIISALEEAVGKEGTLLFASFTRSYLYLGGPCREWNFRPYDISDPGQIWTGNIPKTVIRTRKDALRSRHVSHAWCGFGPLAKECLSQAPDDSPASINSPMGIAMKHGAKILHFGSNLSSTTFLHLLEDVCNVPFLGDAVCAEKAPDGSTKVHVIRKHLPGHRDFYVKDTFNCKFYKAAIPAGLQIHRQTLGEGELLLMDAQEYYRIGKPIVEKDYRILLCDNPDCAFCSKYK